MGCARDLYNVLTLMASVMSSSVFQTVSALLNYSVGRLIPRILTGASDGNDVKKTMKSVTTQSVVPLSTKLSLFYCF